MTPSPLAGEGWGEGKGPFRVFACNWLTFRTWCATWNQWRIAAGMSGAVRLGMDWGQVESSLRLAGIKRHEWPAVFEGLQVMENEALETLNRE